MSFFNSAREVTEVRERTNREFLILCNHMANTFSTPAGKEALNWLKEACYMAGPMNNLEIESEASLHRIAARRDLFIVLQNMISKGKTDVRR